MGEARLERRVEREEPPRHFSANHERIVAILDPEVRLEQFDDGPVRGRLAVGESSRGQDEPALAAMGLCDLPDEARLADARLTHEGYDLTVTCGGPSDDAAQLLQL